MYFFPVFLTKKKILNEYLYTIIIYKSNAWAKENRMSMCRTLSTHKQACLKSMKMKMVSSHSHPHPTISSLGRLEYWKSSVNVWKTFLNSRGVDWRERRWNSTIFSLKFHQFNLSWHFDTKKSVVTFFE